MKSFELLVQSKSAVRTRLDANVCAFEKREFGFAEPVPEGRPTINAQKRRSYLWHSLVPIDSGRLGFRPRKKNVEKVLKKVLKRHSKKAQICIRAHLALRSFNCSSHQLPPVVFLPRFYYFVD